MPEAAVWTLVAALGACGAYARVRLTAAIDRRSGLRLPVGTLSVNLAGGFVLGVLYGARAAPQALIIVGGGLLGSFTTFSTWMLDTDRLASQAGAVGATLNLVLPALTGLAAAAAGWALGRTLAG